MDFPDPFRPSTRISRPAATSADTSRTTQGCLSPYRFPTASSRIGTSKESIATTPALELAPLRARYVTNWCNKSAERVKTGHISRQTVENKARASKTDA